VRLHLAIATCLLAASAACGRDSDSGSSPSSVDKLGAEGLYHSVMLLRHAPGKPPARAARLVGLAEFARRLAPDDPRINNAIAYLSLVRDKKQALAQAVKKSIPARSGDHALALQWLSLEMDGFQDARLRSAFLGKVIIDARQSPELRAAAAVYLADILIGQGLREKASEAFAAAVKLDPHLSAALVGQLALAEKSAPADRAKILVKELMVNPRSLRQAAELGEMLDAAGLYEQAARFYDYAWRVNKVMGLGRKASLDFAVQHCNALLNAGQYRQAVDIFGPISRRFADSVLLRALLIEACNHSEQTDRAKMYAGEIEAIFAPKISGGTADPAAEAELAWLYLISGSDIDLALDYAGRAVTHAPRAPASIKAMAAAQLVSGKKSIVDLGRVIMEKTADKDVFAAAFLAEHYFKINRNADGKKLVLSGLALSRSGQAARRLSALAKKYEITIPSTDGGPELQALAESIPDTVLAVGLAPDRFFQLTAVVPPRVNSCDGIPVQVELYSAYDGKVSAGLGGFIPATVTLDVAVSGRKIGKFKDVIRLVLPIGRYLSVRQKITVSGRIDVGKLNAMLVANPLDELKLTVTPRLVDPGAETPDQEALSAKLAAAKPGVIARTSIMGVVAQSSITAWRKTYKQSLSLIMGDLKTSDLKVRIRAGRQIASLLVLADGIRANKLRPPSQLAGRINREVLVLMAAEVLKNRSDVVRAEMLAALGDVKLDASIIRSLGSIIADSSALVRFRLVELLGASGLSGQEPILKHFTKDKYPLVADLAKAMLTATKGD
jgi:tetratricopeptide (TPR) repeat protein